MQRLLKLIQGTYPLLDQLVVSAASFLTILICTKKLPLEQVGVVSYYIIIYSISLLLNSAFIFQKASVNAPLHKDKVAYYHELLNVQVYLNLLNTGVLTVIAWNIIDIDGYNIILFAIFLFFQQLTDFERKTAYICKTKKDALLSTILTYPLRIVMLALLPIQSSQDILVIFILTSITVPLLQRIKNTNYVKFSGKLNIVKLYVLESKWLIATAILSFMWGRLPVIIVGETLGIAAAAIFMALRSLTNIANLGLELLETYFSPVLGRKYHKAKPSYFSLMIQVFLVGFTLWCCGFVVFYGFNEKIVSFLYTTAYSQYAKILVLFWIIGLAIFLSRLLFIHMRTIGLEKYNFLAFVGGIILLQTLYFLYLINYGIEGMALAILVSSCFVIFIQWITICLIKRNA